jgi:hypothetical protein
MLVRRSALVAAAALTMGGCGQSGELAPQQYPGAAEQLLTQSDLDRQPEGTPRADLLDWWRSSQYAERMGFLEGFASVVADRLASRTELDSELEYFSGGLRVARPEVTETRIVGRRATVFTMLRVHQPLGSARFVTTKRPQAFPMVLQRGRWRIADDHFFQTYIAPLDARRRTG